MQIELENISKRWKEVAALEHVSCTAAAGELLVMLGPSGCGKSTLLRIIAGLETASGGSVRINGADVTGLPPSRRNISMVFQSYALFPHLNVEENITFGLKVRRVSAEARKRRLDRVVELLDMGGLLQRRPAELSGGQRQRVALGRAIVSEAPVCLMDEPLSNLDAKLRHEMRREIRSLQQRLGITMVYVTHDQTEAMTMADRIVLLNAGRVEQIATPEELYMRPSTTFTAAFIGAPPMNLLPAGDPGMTDWLKANIPEVFHHDAPRNLIIGIRPEEMRLAETGLPAEISGIEYLGADSHLTCKIAGRECIIRQGGAVRVEMGMRVLVNWPALSTNFFETGSGIRWEPSGLPRMAGSHA